MPVFFVPPRCITPPTVSITGGLLTHLRDSLRVKVGDTVFLADDEHHRYRAEITAIAKQSMAGHVIDVITGPPRHAPSLVLGQATLKGEKMDWVIQKAIELGVQTVIPLDARHGIVHLKVDRIETQAARWQRIALEAAQQSEQWHIPTIARPRPLPSITAALSQFSLTLMLTERRDQIRTLADVPLPTSAEGSILVLVGPEGGWAEDETEAVEQAGGIPITLGSKILRAETAAIIAIGIVQHRLGELG